MGKSQLKKTKMRALFYLGIFTLVFASSCKKGTIEPITPAPTTVTNFKAIKANENFDWKTSSEFTLKVKGFPTLSPVSNTLKIISVDEKVVYSQFLHAMDQNLEVKFILPIDVKEFKVQYGSINKKYSTNEKIVEFDFIMDNPE